GSSTDPSLVSSSVGTYSSVNRQIRESMGEGGRNSRANENPILAILALEITSDLVKLRKTLTRVEGYEQLKLGEPLADRTRDPLLQHLEALAGLRRDQSRVGMSQAELSAFLLIEQVDLVHHQQP